jgi:hypothetical protein
MKPQWLALVLPLSVVNVLVGLTSANAQETQETKFLCGAWRVTPITVAQTSHGEVPIIYWVSDWVNDPKSNLTPQSRCEIVSENFQRAYDRGQLRGSIPIVR